MNKNSGSTLGQSDGSGGNITWELAHLAHVELLTPKLDESIKFFTDILGMYVTEAGWRFSISSSV